MMRVHGYKEFVGVAVGLALGLHTSCIAGALCFMLYEYCCARLGCGRGSSSGSGFIGWEVAYF